MNLVVAPSSEALAERDILGVKVAVLDRTRAIRLIEDRLASGAFTRLAFLNAHCSNMAWRDEKYRAALSNLLGSTPENVEKAAEGFRRIAPQHEFFVVSDGYFREADIPALLQRIGTLKIDILLVAMGVPKQEVFIAGQVHEGHVRIAAGVGALFDFISGAVPRAPLWVRDWRLEWAYRLLNEPFRLWRRYVIGNPVFIVRVYLRKLFGRKR